MNKNDNNKFVFAVMLILGIFGFCMFSENLSNILFSNNQTQQEININTIKNILEEDSSIVETQALNKSKRNNLNLKLYLDNDYFFLNQDNLVNSDILEVSLVGGQSIKNTTDFLLNKGYSLEKTFNTMFSNWDSLLNSFLSKYEIEPCDSLVTFSPNSTPLFSFSQESMGKKVDREKFYNELYSKLDDNIIEINLKLEEAKPNFSVAKNKEITGEVSHFITDLSTSKKNRHHNVTQALNKINGLVIMPKQVVSFNALTSPHNAEGGYTDATIISNGEYVNGMGGGICQASSTLYNAVLLAGLKVNQVFKHSIPVSYVKMGLDSMVSSFSDLVFENTSDYPIYIKAYTDKESAYVYLYGKTMEKNEKIVRRNEIVKTITPPDTITIIDEEKKYYPKIEFQDDVLEIKSARNGYEVNAYLDYYKDNKLIKTQKIRHEIYPPQARVIVKGSKIRPVLNQENQESINKQPNSQNNIVKNDTNINTNTLTNNTNANIADTQNVNLIT